MPNKYQSLFTTHTNIIESNTTETNFKREMNDLSLLLQDGQTVGLEDGKKGRKTRDGNYTVAKDGSSIHIFTLYKSK